MKKNLLAIIIIIFVWGCSDKNTKKINYYKSGKIKSEWYARNEIMIEYYENGKIKCKENYKGGKKEGKAIYYNKEGYVEEIAFWENGSCNGINQKFYRNGTIKEEGLFKNGKAVGWSFYYSETSELAVKRQYLIIDTVSHLNQVIYFKSNGDTINNKSMYFHIIAPDTISYLDSFAFLIEINPIIRDGEIQFHTGNYNEKFQINDSSSIKVWGDINFKTAAYVYPKNKGKNVVRGIIINYDSTKAYENYVEIEFVAK